MLLSSSCSYTTKISLQDQNQKSSVLLLLLFSNPSPNQFPGLVLRFGTPSSSQPAFPHGLLRTCIMLLCLPAYTSISQNLLQCTPYNSSSFKFPWARSPVCMLLCNRAHTVLSSLPINICSVDIKSVYALYQRIHMWLLSWGHHVEVILPEPSLPPSSIPFPSLPPALMSEALLYQF